MATFDFTSPEGKQYSINGPDDATREQAFGILQEQIAAGKGADFEVAAPSIATQAGALINKLPGYLGRQAGLTARYALEGPAEAAQIVTEPLRYLTDRATSMTGQTTPLSVQAGKLADTLGLPKPENPAERVAAAGSRLMAGTGGASKALQLLGTAAPAVNLSGATPTLLGNPLAWLRDARSATSGLRDATNAMGAQLGSAAGAGTFGQASKEAGGGQLEQLGASVLGGVAGGALGSQVRPAIDGIRARFSASRMPDTQVDIQLRSSIGSDWDTLPESVRQTLRADARRALGTGGTLDADAMRNLADFTAVGARPTRGMLTQDPGQVTREKNAAKLAAQIPGASGPGSLVQLADDNNTALIGALNRTRTGTEVNPAATGRAVVDSVTNTRDGLRGAERAAWNAARNHPGIAAPIEPNGLSAINQRLGDEALMPFMSPGVSRYIEALQTNPGSYTPQAYANLRSMLSGELAKGGNEARAARAAIDALDAAPLIPIKRGAHLDFGNAPVPSAVADRMRAMDAAAGEAVDLVNQARAATRQAYAYEESSPLVQSIVSGARNADPERIAAGYLLNPKATVADGERVREVLGPQGLETVRAGLATWIKKQAVSGAEDDLGKVSGAALKNLLKDQDERLGVFFSPEEVAQLQRINRVAQLIDRQGAGTAVNNSNSAGTLMGHTLDFLGRHGQKIPMLGGATQAASVGLTQRMANNTAPALVTPDLQRRLGAPALIGPGAALGGLLALPGSQ